MYSNSSSASDCRRFNGVCNHCKIRGHKRENYYRLHGFRPNFKFTKKMESLAVVAANTLVDGLSLDFDFGSQSDSVAAPVFTRA